nr:DUF1206 domain-containing protein [Ornithinimicrobium murale]
MQDLAAEASNSDSLEFLARFGYVGSGLVHLLIAWIAGQVALGSSGEADEAGALQQLGSSPGGSGPVVGVCRRFRGTGRLAPDRGGAATPPRIAGPGG